MLHSTDLPPELEPRVAKIDSAISIRFATDYIRTSLFDEKQNNVRIAAGLIYRFGGEVKSTKSR